MNDCCLLVVFSLNYLTALFFLNRDLFFSALILQPYYAYSAHFVGRLPTIRSILLLVFISAQRVRWQAGRA